MNDNLFNKKPAFFPSVSAEIFFEAEAEIEELATLDVNLDSELDEILSTT